MDLDVTSPKQLNRRLFLKQLAVDLCTSERRILFRTQYVRSLICIICRLVAFILCDIFLRQQCLIRQVHLGHCSDQLRYV